MSWLFGAGSGDKANTSAGSPIDALPGGASGMTVAAIVRRTSDGSSQYVAQKSLSYVTGWGLSIANGGAEGRLQFEVYDATTDPQSVGNTTAANLATLNVWKCVAATYLKTTAPKLYIGDRTTIMAEVSGYASQVVGTSSPVTDATGQLNVGNIVYPSAAAPFKGDIAYFALWNNVVSVGRMELFRQFPRMVQAGMVCLLDFTHGSSTIPDLTGNGHNATITGATASLNPPWARRRGS